ncbi:hypothetical protein [Jannaschia sp. LMIT008]|uniref:hypothetical protein n=1 Tax=Jannaschia maritima TaxID=3032585 RepID=UPI0028117381|nr:hypothetical protein [Jannaschia sp. LMIT008]
MRPTPLLLPLVLAACIDTVSAPAGGGPVGPVVESGPARVAEVTIRPSRLSLRMTDGERCEAERPEGVQSGWSGVTGGCRYAMPFAVTFARGGSPARFRIEEPSGTLQGGVPGPRAEIFVTEPDGIRRLFLRPLPERLFRGS